MEKTNDLNEALDALEAICRRQADEIASLKAKIERLQASIERLKVGAVRILSVLTDGQDGLDTQ